MVRTVERALAWWAMLLIAVSLVCNITAVAAQPDAPPMCVWNHFFSVIDAGDERMAAASFGLAAYDTVFDALTDGTELEPVDNFVELQAWMTVNVTLSKANQGYVGAEAGRLVSLAKKQGAEGNSTFATAQAYQFFNTTGLTAAAEFAEAEAQARSARVHCAAPIELPETAASAPNIQYVGRGYDLINGCPREVGGSVDLGFRLPVIDLTYRLGRFTPDGLYALPDAVEVRGMPSVALSSSVSHVATESQFRSQLERSVSASASFKAGRYAEASFAGSASYQQTVEAISNIDTNYVDIEASAVSYEASIRYSAQSARLPLTKDFRDAVARLPTDYVTGDDNTTLAAFVDAYGTHFIAQVTMGGVGIERYVLTSSELNTYKATVASQAVDASGSAKFAGASASMSFDYKSTQQSEARSALAQTSSSRTDWYYGGQPGDSAYGDDESSTEALKDWASYVDEKPVPISYKVTDLPDLLNDLIFDEDDDIELRRVSLWNYLYDLIAPYKEAVTLRTAATSNVNNDTLRYGDFLLLNGVSFIPPTEPGEPVQPQASTPSLLRVYDTFLKEQGVNDIVFATMSPATCPTLVADWNALNSTFPPLRFRDIHLVNDQRPYSSQRDVHPFQVIAYVLYGRDWQPGVARQLEDDMVCLMTIARPPSQVFAALLPDDEVQSSSLYSSQLLPLNTVFPYRDAFAGDASKLQNWGPVETVFGFPPTNVSAPSAGVHYQLYSHNWFSVSGTATMDSSDALQASCPLPMGDIYNIMDGTGVDYTDICNDFCACQLGQDSASLSTMLAYPVCNSTNICWAGFQTAFPLIHHFDPFEASPNRATLHTRGFEAFAWTIVSVHSVTGATINAVTSLAIFTIAPEMSPPAPGWNGGYWFVDLQSDTHGVTMRYGGRFSFCEEVGSVAALFRDIDFKYCQNIRGFTFIQSDGYIFYDETYAAMEGKVLFVPDIANRIYKLLDFDTVDPSFYPLYPPSYHADLPSDVSEIATEDFFRIEEHQYKLASVMASEHPDADELPNMYHDVVRPYLWRLDSINPELNIEKAVLQYGQTVHLTSEFGGVYYDQAGRYREDRGIANPKNDSLSYASFIVRSTDPGISHGPVQTGDRIFLQVRSSGAQESSAFSLPSPRVLMPWGGLVPAQSYSYAHVRDVVRDSDPQWEAKAGIQLVRVPREKVLLNDHFLEIGDSKAAALSLKRAALRPWLSTDEPETLGNAILLRFEGSLPPLVINVQAIQRALPTILRSSSRKETKNVCLSIAVLLGVFSDAGQPSEMNPGVWRVDVPDGVRVTLVRDAPYRKGQTVVPAWERTERDLQYPHHDLVGPINAILRGTQTRVDNLCFQLP